MKIYLPLLLLLAMFSCKSTGGTMSQGDGNYAASLFAENGWSWNTNPKYILRLENEGNFNLKLDVNSCFGQFKLAGSSISFPQGIACTEACCDGPEALKLTQAISKVSSYELLDNRLILKGPEPALEFTLSNE